MWIKKGSVIMISNFVIYYYIALQCQSARIASVQVVEFKSYLDFEHSKHMIIKLNPSVWNPTEFHGLVKFLASRCI